jgi:di/tricarboxylate transporter
VCSRFGGTTFRGEARWRRSCVTPLARDDRLDRQAPIRRGAALSDSTITFIVLGVTVAVFVWDRLPVGVVAFGVALSLWATGVLDLEQALGGFGDPTVIFIASLFVVSEGLDSTGVTAWAGQQLIDRAGDSRTRVVVLTMLLVALLTAMISVNGSVAALLPVAAVMAIRLRMPPSLLLMPLAFGAHAGSLLALTGSPVNVIVSEAADDAGVGRFGFFEFALVGVPLVAGTIAVVVLLGERLLPERKARSTTKDFGDLARTLVEQYALDQDPAELVSRGSGVAEVVIPPRSGLVGEVVYPGMATESGDLVVLAVQRRGDDLQGETTLAVGDTMLLRGAWSDLEYHLDDPDVLVVDDPALVRRQAVPLGPGGAKALLVLAGMVVLLALGAVPPAVAGLLAAGAMILSGVLTVEGAYRGISWTTVILVAGMIPLSTAMVSSGAAETLAEGLVDVVGDAGPRALLVGLVLLTFVLGQLISNMATALIVIPIAVSASAELDVSPKPVLMAVCVAAAAAFLTPVATPANLMVMGPGGYRFGDYWKLGLPLLVLFGLVATLLVPVFWPF